MPSTTRCFLVPDTLQLTSQLEDTSLRYAIVFDQAQDIQRCYLDSFDWRLYHHGWSLHSEQTGNSDRLTLCDRQDGRSLLTITTHRFSHRPRFSQQCPPTLRQWLDDILENRAMMPVAKLHIQRIPGRVIDKSEKTLVRLHIDRVQVMPEHTGQWQPCDTRCYLTALRGYDKPYHDLKHYLTKTLARKPTPHTPLPTIFKALGKVPGHYSARPKLHLASTQRSDRAMKTVLSALFDIMSVNTPGILEDIDSEFLHDFRTAIRRSRSVLSQIKRVFPQRQTRRFNQALSWLGDATTPLRDLDVYLLSFPVYQARLPETLRTGFKPLQGLLEQQRTAVQHTLCKILTGRRFQRFMADWYTFLQSPPPVHTPLKNAMETIQFISGKRIRKLYGKVCAQGLAIHDNSPPEALHGLRKTCKKLRYLLEIFSSCLHSPGPNALIRSLKTLQGLLGNYQDCHVQIASLHQFKRLIDQPNTDTITAIDWLITDLDQRQHELRSAFKKAFAQWLQAKNHQRIRRLTDG